MTRGMSRRKQISLGPGREILTIARLATELGVSRTTIRNMIEEGRLPSPFKISARRFGFRRSEILRWIAEEGENEPVGIEAVASVYITDGARAFLEGPESFRKQRG